MTYIFNFFIIIPIINFILLAINFIFALQKPYKEKKTPFECGYHSFLSQNRTQFSISFFIFGLLFLLFDIEILSVYPITVSSYFNGGYGISVIIIFILVLTLGFVFELGKGALVIDTKQEFKFLQSSVSGLVWFLYDYTNKVSNCKNKRKLVLFKEKYIYSIKSKQYSKDVVKSTVKFIKVNFRSHVCFIIGLRIFNKVALISKILYIIYKVSMFLETYILFSTFTQIVYSFYLFFVVNLSFRYIANKLRYSFFISLFAGVITAIFYYFNMLSIKDSHCFIKVFILLYIMYKLYINSTKKTWAFNLTQVILVFSLLGLVWYVLNSTIEFVFLSFSMISPSNFIWGYLLKMDEGPGGAGPSGNPGPSGGSSPSGGPGGSGDSGGYIFGGERKDDGDNPSKTKKVKTWTGAMIPVKIEEMCSLYSKHKYYPSGEMSVAVDTPSSHQKSVLMLDIFFPKAIEKLSSISTTAFENTKSAQEAIDAITSQTVPNLVEAMEKKSFMEGAIWGTKCTHITVQGEAGARLDENFRMQEEKFLTYRESICKLKAFKKYPDYKGHFDLDGKWVDFKPPKKV